MLLRFLIEGAGFVETTAEVLLGWRRPIRILKTERTSVEGSCG